MPIHIGLIMDGNGRWAKKIGKSRHHGHKFGLLAFKNIVAYASKLDSVQELTTFALSRDNFKRSQLEISALLVLFEQVLTKELPWFVELGIKVKFIGDKTAFTDGIKSLMQQFEMGTRLGVKLQLNVAINYSGKQQLVAFVKQHSLPDDTEQAVEFIDNNLAISDIDLLIRSSGEQRLSDFCLWQLAYAELYFAECLWPDFSAQELDNAIAWYSRRQRRFGDVSE